MIPGTWLLSGIPRSGSSLCCRLAGELPDTVALSEPMRRDALAGVDTPDEACLRVETFAVRARARILAAGRAPSIQVDGQLNDDMVEALLTKGGLRRRQGQSGEIEVRKPLSSGFTLLIKHNALFAALLPPLGVSFKCLAVVRNPLAVLASWQTVDLPVHRGRIPAGEQFDRELYLALEREPGVIRRQVAVLNWFFAAFRAHLDAGQIFRYEDLIESGGVALFRRMGRPGVPPVALENRNGNRLYRHARVDTLLAALLRDGGAWQAFYTAADCERVADMICSHR